ncbi:unnamed protein product [Angiostrongylus costaricensis]|uniref:Uncharacterized protein n=1 Tax=Angiostrongylus costaricensis TaxID=334426 RepID=A0A0R3Q1R2_ANGCS|nr:unnamed protein product [Angiostrongylus costaricensis]
MKRHRPQFGHMANGSFVEVQQDTEHNFEATFVECTDGHHRPPCHGIDTVMCVIVVFFMNVTECYLSRLSLQSWRQPSVPLWTGGEQSYRAEAEL